MKPEILKALKTLKTNDVSIEDIKKYLEQEEITDEIKPVLVGHSERPMGYGGFKTMETGHEIYEFEGKYIMFQESLKNGEKVKVSFYKESFYNIKYTITQEQLKSITDKTNRSFGQTQHLYTLVYGDFEKLKQLEMKIKNCLCFYCPGDRKEVDQIMKMSNKVNIFNI